MITEEEAQSKWCPFVRMTEHGDSYNRCGPAANLQCIASACMAWRKAGQIGIDANGRKVDRDLDGRVRWRDIGYCGLAGAPVKP